MGGAVRSRGLATKGSALSFLKIKEQRLDALDARVRNPALPDFAERGFWDFRPRLHRVEVGPLQGLDYVVMN